MIMRSLSLHVYMEMREEVTLLVMPAQVLSCQILCKQLFLSFNVALKVEIIIYKSVKQV